MRRQIFGDGEGVHAGGERLQTLLVVFDDFDGLHEGVHAEAGGEARGAGGRQHVVGTGHVVAQRNRGIRATEDGARVADLGNHRVRIGGLHFEVLGGVCVGRVDGLLDAIREDDAGLAATQRRVDALGMLRPDIEPHATANIDGIIDIVKRLLENGNAYVAGNGDVMFSIDSFPEYGRLSGQKLDDLRAGARVGVEESKHNPYDFVLWKMSKPGEPEWDSPWGKGRPGWHIECSAMNHRYLGDKFDIHGGGSDLIFPHHENEIAQSCCAFHTTYVNTWIHSGMVMINKEKMSKSLGNFFTIRDVLKEHAPEAVRFFLLSGQYRTALNYSKENLEQARAALARLYTALRGVDLSLCSGGAENPYAEYEKRFREAMDDDFNTPLALSVLFELAREVNSLKEKNDSAAVNAGLMLKKLGGVLGILQDDPESFLKGGSSSGDEGGDAEIEALVRERNDARSRKDWKAADAARNKLQELGIVLEDGPNGTVWRRK